MNFDYILNHDKYHAAPPRLDGEKDEQYKLRLQAYSMGIQSQQAKIDELEFNLSSTVNNFDNSCKTIDIHQKFLDDADVDNKFLTDKIDELQARIDGALEKCYIGIRKQGGDHYLELVEDILKGNKDEN